MTTTSARCSSSVAAAVLLPAALEHDLAVAPQADPVAHPADRQAAALPALVELDLDRAALALGGEQRVARRRPASGRR